MHIDSAPLPSLLFECKLTSGADWIEIDKEYERDLAMKKEVVAEFKENVLNSLPENDEAAGELLETLVDYLPKVRGED